MLTEKEVYSLAGEVNAACNIMREVAISLYRHGNCSEETRKLAIQAKETCELLRKALRAVSYEVDNVREDGKGTSRPTPKCLD